MTSPAPSPESPAASDKRLRVAMLASTGDRCGIAAYSHSLISALREFADVEVEPIEVGRQSEDHYSAQAERLNRADVIHIQHEHSFWGGILPNQSAYWTMRYLLQKPVVITAHTTTSLRDLLRVPTERRPIHRIAKELLVRRRAYRDSIETAPFITGRCIVHTREAGEELVARGANGKYIHVIPAGVPDPLAAPTGGKRFRALFPPGSRIVSLFGFVAPNKGYELMFEALNSLPPDVVLLIAGGARNEEMRPYEQQIRRFIEEKELESRVRMTGHLSEEEIADAMAAADVAAGPHTQATGSYSIMIPLAYGKAIVASDLACFREMQEQGECVELFRSGDPAALAIALAHVLDNPERRATLEKRAKSYARTHSWGEVARRTVEVYREAIADESRLSHHARAAG